MSEYISNEGAFRNFVESSVWKDMSYEINTRLEQIRDALESSGGDETLESTERLRGAAKAFRQVLAMPEDIMQNVIADREREEDGRKRD